MNIANHRRPIKYSSYLSIPNISTTFILHNIYLRYIKRELEIVKMLWPDPNSSAYETFEKCSILFEYKEGEN